MPGNPRKLWLVGLDETGEKEWEKIIDEFSADNRIWSIVSASEETFYIIGTVNADTGSYGEILLMEVDANGTILQQKVHNLGIDDQGIFGVTTNDGGLLVGGAIDHWWEGSVFKVNDSLEIEWVRQNVFPDCGVGRGLVELESGSFVVSGCRETASSAPLNEMSIIKLAPNGDTEWERIYGGAYDDYGYDMTTTPDGGFIISGRTETPGHADVYIVKTNCMGLLTEPQATFDYTTTELTTQFINTSQYVYPDSTDGGYYHWNFGDGSTSAAINPLHTYGQSGIYTVTLTGIVCTDTSVFIQEINVGAVGITTAEPTFSVSPFYPNPARQTATMTYDLGIEKAVLQVFDITGRLLKSVDLKGKGSFEMDLVDWATGIYFYQVTATSVAHDFNRGRHNSRAILREKLVVLE